MEALRIFYTLFSSSEKFRGTELMCLPSLPRLRSQTRHIPALCLFYFLNLYRNQNFPRKIDVSRTKFVCAKIFLHPMTQNLHTKHGSYQGVVQYGIVLLPGSYESQSTRILVPKNRMEQAWKKSVAPIRILARKIVPRNLSIVCSKLVFFKVLSHTDTVHAADNASESAFIRYPGRTR